MGELPIKVDEYRRVLDNKLTPAFQNAMNIVNKTYLQSLESMDVVNLSEEEADIDISKCGKFYKMNRLVLNKEENFLDKLVTIVNVAHAVDGTLATIVHSDGNSVWYYMGIISKKYRQDNSNNNNIREASASAFSGAVEGNFAGSEIQELNQEDIKTMSESVFPITTQSISSISGVVSLRSKERRDVEEYVQGIENLTDSLKGKKYSIVLIADPVNSEKLQNIKHGYEMIYSELSTFSKQVLTMNESDNVAMSTSQMEGITKGLSEGISRTQSRGTINSKSIGLNSGVNLSFFGIGGSVGGFKANTKGETEGETFGNTSSTSEQTARQKSSSTSTAMGTGKSIQVSYENRMVNDLLDKIDMKIKRIDSCESYGAFDCAAYVISNNIKDGITVSGNYSSLMKGEESCVQSFKINTWTKNNYLKNQKVDHILECLKSFVHPSFYFSRNEDIMVNPSTIVSGGELAIQFGLPKKSINGLSVIKMTPFGRNINNNSNNEIKLGSIYHMGREEQDGLYINSQSLTSHTFVTGSTGVGKSNAIYNILSQIENKNIPYLVIEPAKGEYKHIFGNKPDVYVFGTNAKKTPLLKINPFKFPSDIHVLEHIDRLIEIFNVCWPMYAAMPAVLKESVERAYKSAGWDLNESENKLGFDVFPNFEDVLTELNLAIKESAFSLEVKGNYIGSLATRIKSLTNGINGQIFVDDEIQNEVLFDSKTIIDLSRVMSGETKSLIMGILVMRLQEHRMCQGGMNRELRHITVLEEAHNLLKRTSAEQYTESSNVTGKSVEMISNAIAEMRTYGEGFIIVDQSPEMVDMSAIRNTNTKIILRLPDINDRELCGRSANLNEGQIEELSRLSTGVAAVYQNDWLEPVLCKVKKFDSPIDEYRNTYHKTSVEDKKLKVSLLKCLLGKIVGEKVEYSIDDMKERIFRSQFNTNVKIKIYNVLCEAQVDKISDVSAAVASLFETEGLFKKISNAESIDTWNNKIESGLDCDFQDLGSAYKNVVLQCVIREESMKNIEFNDVYSKWTEYMRGVI